MLYTRKGDHGTTRDFVRGQPRISKASDLPEALGTLDELNSFLGVCKARGAREPFLVPNGKRSMRAVRVLQDVQETLFIVQAQVAGAPKKVGRGKVDAIERLTDSIEKTLPPITSFTIAGATELSALLDVARTLARRAERRLVGIHETGQRPLTKHTLAYANRLSSLLFALARLASNQSGARERAPRYR
ncbi:MAG: ATP:cob(I)alamin adenosyltransferase [Parcubacteria group bacterium 21-54-25]|nr:MAG: ATP:cob(I)alamin adenosyltransferase [Parcubacteria group bacterium 21-54-25]HQU07536.1 cob(I)yrinic acid a,c-diamide adenosyltransferase [Candidatus Paceibacterota bacterium]